MRYKKILEGTFLSRPNRFIAQVMIQGKEETCHVKNTGRCKELLVPGARVFVEESDNPNRKTKYDLIAVYKGNILINMDSQIPNAVVQEWLEKGGLFSNISLVKREVTFGDSRFDLYVEYEDKKVFIEVKGVTLEQEGVARFPDAPTLRGVKHVEELKKCLEEGYEAYIIFVIQMKGIRQFEPNWNTHAQFGEALVRAKEAGVNVLAYDCLVTPDSIVLEQEIKVCL